MADLQVNYSGWAGYDWTGYFVVGYTTSYDPVTNTTTVTLSESVRHSYTGLLNYRTSATLNITVRANDSGSSGTASGSLTSTTNGGWDNYYSYPSPRVITVQHNNNTGAKSVTISASSTLNVWIGYSNESVTSGSGAVSVTTGERKGYHCIDDGSKILQCIPYIDDGSKWLECIPYVDNGSTWKIGN